MSSREPSNVRDVGLTTATTGLSFLAVLIAGIVLSRVLGPTGKGQIAQLFVWASFAVDICLFGLTGATTYSVARWPEFRSRLMSVVGRRLFLQALCGLLLFSAAFVARGAEAGLPLAAVVAYAAWIPAAMLVAVSTGYFQGRGDFVRFNWVRLLSWAAPLVGLVVLGATQRLTVSTAAVVYLSAVGSAGLLGVVWTWKESQVVDTGLPTTVTLVEVLRSTQSFAWRDYASTLATKSNRSVDLLVVSLLPIAAADIGIYSVATTSSGAIAMVGMSIGMVTFSRSAQGRHQNRWVKPLIWWAVLLTVIAALSLYLLALYLFLLQ